MLVTQSCPTLCSPMDYSPPGSHSSGKNIGVGSHLLQGIFLVQELNTGGGSEVKASARNVGDLGLISGSGRFPGEGNGNPLQYSCLENPMDGEA